MRVLQVLANHEAEAQEHVHALHGVLARELPDLRGVHALEDVAFHLGEVGADEQGEEGVAAAVDRGHERNGLRTGRVVTGRDVSTS